MRIKKAIIVEDDPDAREVVTRMLVRFGYHVLAAADGPTALELVFTERPDLVCIDLGLPNISGFDVCEAIRRNPDSREVPILVTTGRSSPQDEALCERMGADGFLVKPFQSTALAEAIARVTRPRTEPIPIRPEVVR